MRFDKLLEPISDEEPCGPDLDEIGDDDFLNYTFAAEDRLPLRFFDPDTGAPFDRSTIDLKAEVKQITKLLESSRDLRLLVLDARFHCLSGQIVGFSESIIAAARLLEKFWEEVHPVGTDGNFFMRQNTLETLSSRITVLLPLQFATLLTDKRSGALSYRQHAISLGELEPREGEETLDAGSIATAFSNEDNKEAVTAMHATIVSTIEALESIRNSFVENSGFDYAPSFEELIEELGKYKRFLEVGVPTLAGGDDSNDEGSDAGEEEGDGADSGSSSKKATIPTTLSDGTKILISNQSSATKALSAAEAYFAESEPSTPALILVHQARELIGKPLVDALKSLLPEMAETAIIKLDASSKFEIKMARMQDLSSVAVSGKSATDNFVGPKLEDAAFVAKTRLDATALVLAVEGYYRSSEPSSPVPLLLSKAREYLSKDFSAIIKDLIDTEVKKT